MQQASEHNPRTRHRARSTACAARIVTALAAAVAVMAAFPASAALPSLFEATPSAGAQPRSTSAAAILPVSPRFDVLTALAARSRQGETPAFAVDVGDGTAHEAEVAFAQTAENGATSIAFAIPGVEHGSGVATTLGDVMLMDVWMGGRHYVVRRAPDGSHGLRDVSDVSFGVELPPRPAPASPGTVDHLSTRAAGVAAADVPADSGRLIDVMTLWNAAAQGAASTSDMNALAAQAVATANAVYANSGIAQRLRLVYSAAVTYTTCATPADAGDYWGCALDDLTDAQGTLSVVPALRNQHGADLVTLLVEPGGGICGIGWIPLSIGAGNDGNGFNVIAASCAVGNLSYPHELGHNMGANHDTYVSPGTTGPRAYNHGYVQLANRWRTVMAYNDQCVANGFSCARLPLMSTPDYAVDTNAADATPPAVMGDASLRNVARVLNLTAKMVASYRPTSALHPVVASFSDVPAGNSQFGAVEFMKQAGITSGCTAGTYCPDDAITRRQMAVFLERTRKASIYTPAAATGMFTDVPVDSQFADYIEQLARDGITTGCGSGIYCPEQPVTRAQMAIFLLRASCGTSYTPQAATGTVFADVAAGDSGAAYVEKIYRLGVTGGCATGPLRYCPAAPLTRGQMAVFVERMFPFVSPSETCTP